MVVGCPGRVRIGIASRDVMARQLIAGIRNDRPVRVQSAARPVDQLREIMPPRILTYGMQEPLHRKLCGLLAQKARPSVRAAVGSEPGCVKRHLRLSLPSIELGAVDQAHAQSYRSRSSAST